MRDGPVPRGPLVAVALAAIAVYLVELSLRHHHVVLAVVWALLGAFNVARALRAR